MYVKYSHLLRDFYRCICEFYWIVPDFGGQSLDTDPNFGRYMHFCGTIIDIGTDKNPNKFGVNNTISDKYAVLWIGFI